jgi:hypothetical protein
MHDIQEYSFEKFTVSKSEYNNNDSIASAVEKAVWVMN